MQLAAKLAGLSCTMGLYISKYSKYKIVIQNMNDILNPNVKILLEISSTIWDKRVLKIIQRYKQKINDIMVNLDLYDADATQVSS